MQLFKRQLWRKMREEQFPELSIINSIEKKWKNKLPDCRMRMRRILIFWDLYQFCVKKCLAKFFSFSPHLCKTLFPISISVELISLLFFPVCPEPSYEKLLIPTFPIFPEEFQDMNFSLPPAVIHDLYKYFVDTLIMGILLSFMMALVALLYACLDPAMVSFPSHLKDRLYNVRNYSRKLALWCSSNN